MTDVGQADHGFGLFGEAFGYPGGGFCISAFVVPRVSGRILVGQMREHPRWEVEWAPNLRYYEGELRAWAFGGLRLPATYLREGEHPDAAARRVWRDQLGLAVEPDLGAPTIVSEAGPSRRYPGHNHWDIVFLYVVDLDEELPCHQDHWARLEWRPLAQLAPGDLVMTHGELLDRLA